MLHTEHSRQEIKILCQNTEQMYASSVKEKEKMKC